MQGTSTETARSGRKTETAAAQQERSVAESLLRLAITVRRGGVQAGFLVACDGVSGFRVIGNPETATAAELRQELAALRERLEDSLISGTTASSPAVEEARQALADAAVELARPETEAARLVLRLAWASDRLLQASEAAQSAHELTPTTGQLTVSAATLWSIATRVFGPGS